MSSVKPAVARQLPTALTPDQKQQVLDCIEQYSTRAVLNIGYRIGQWWNSYPDWDQCAKLLDTRKYEGIPDTGNLTNTIVGNILFAPFAAMSYAAQESGVAKLRRLIKQNSQ